MYCCSPFYDARTLKFLLLLDQDQCTMQVAKLFHLDKLGIAAHGLSGLSDLLDEGNGLPKQLRDTGC